jgi:hypothetical protein
MIVLGTALTASAHMVFDIWFEQTTIMITKPGVYDCDVRVDPLYANVGFVLSVDQDSLPDNVHAMFMPPVGFFKYADDPPEMIKLIVIVGPQAPQGGYTMYCNLTQIIPPYDKDEETIRGPVLSISFSK